ncbi:hypothetical protein [Actinomadura sp. DC4]|uniref:hypothetical protein n=1 Tax=Actinomadura sp. DC4 TaxID=3055069 RepID=UPI0025AFC93C|nr:hypothetical protein [Actinomadura sp. DC4]MDN3352080.1 hypothetical protein [Actinomadura sp. DC4]
MSTSDQRLSAFEEHLLTELRHVVAARPADEPAPMPGPATRRPRRRLVLAGGAVIVATAAVTVADPSLLGMHTSPAYAVERDPDGSIRISINDYRDPKGLQRRIDSFGVKAAVDYLPAGMTCQDSRADFVPPGRMPRAMVDWAPLGGKDHYFKIHPEYIRPGQTFVYTVQVSTSPHHRGQRAAIRLANGPVAPCDPVPGDVVPSRGG